MRYDDVRLFGKAPGGQRYASILRKILSIMSAGRPVVAALNLEGDASRLIEKAECGFCLPPEDPHALADAVLQLYRDASLRENLGGNGRSHAEKHLSIDVCVERYESLLREVVASS